MGKSLATASESVRTKGRAFIEAARRLAGELSVRVQGSEVIEHLQRELDSVSSDAQDSKKIEGNLLTLPPQPTSAGPGPVDPRSLPDLAIFRDEGLIEGEVTVGKSVDTSLLDEALQQVGPYRPAK